MTPVSVIIPAYAAQDTIARPVASLLAQTHPYWEAIIVSDDGCDYEAVLKAQGIEDSRLRFASTGRIGAGPGVARNTGLEAAVCDIIANLDADDAYSERFLEYMLPAAVMHGACTSSTRVIEVGSGRIMQSTMYDLKADQPLVMYDIMRFCPTFAPIVFNRRWCKARWPELHYGEDLLFWLLLLDELPAIYRVNAARYDYYFRKGSLSRPDEETTHGLCERRTGMMDWMQQSHLPPQGVMNREILRGWLMACNDMEHTFGYQLLEIDMYLREVSQRFAKLFARFEANYNLAYA